MFSFLKYCFFYIGKVDLVDVVVVLQVVECGWFVDDGEEYGDEGDSDRGGIEGIGI